MLVRKIESTLFNAYICILYSRAESKPFINAIIGSSMATNTDGDAGDADDDAWRSVSNQRANSESLADDDEVHEIPMDLFRNNEVKYPQDADHLMETHPYFEVFSLSGYVEIGNRTSSSIKNIKLKTWRTKYNTIRTNMQEVTKYAVNM
jgi:hypothetical protein